MHRSIPQSSTRLAFALFMAFAAITAPATVHPQSASVAQTVRSWIDPHIATLMLVDDLGPSDARAVVIRRPGDMPNNIILVTRTTTAADLASAASALIGSRRNRGDTVDREMRALIGATPVGAPPASRKRRASDSAGSLERSAAVGGGSVALAARDLQRLRRAPEFSIPGVGHGPALVIRMSDGKRPTKH